MTLINCFFFTEFYGTFPLYRLGYELVVGTDFSEQKMSPFPSDWNQVKLGKIQSK